MIELIITIAVLSFGVIGVYSAFSAVDALSFNISNNFTAAYLAQEGLEIVRNIRDNNFIQPGNWTTNLEGCTMGCQADYTTDSGVPGATPLGSYGSGNLLKLDSDGFYRYDNTCTTCVATKFKRKITITQPSGPDILKVDVEVFWDYNGKSFNFKTTGYLYNWS